MRIYDMVNIVLLSSKIKIKKMFNSKKDILFCRWFKSKNLVGGGSRIDFRES